jgi:hypothetical protein
MATIQEWVRCQMEVQKHLDPPLACSLPITGGSTKNSQPLTPKRLISDEPYIGPSNGLARLKWHQRLCVTCFVTDAPHLMIIECGPNDFGFAHS